MKGVDEQLVYFTLWSKYWPFFYYWVIYYRFSLVVFKTFNKCNIPDNITGYKFLRSSWTQEVYLLQPLYKHGRVVVSYRDSHLTIKITDVNV